MFIELLAVWTVAVPSMKWPNIYSPSVTSSKISIEIKLTALSGVTVSSKALNPFFSVYSLPTTMRHSNHLTKPHEAHENSRCMSMSVVLLFTYSCNIHQASSRWNVGSGSSRQLNTYSRDHLHSRIPVLQYGGKTPHRPTSTIAIVYIRNVNNRTAVWNVPLDIPRWKAEKCKTSLDLVPMK